MGLDKILISGYNVSYARIAQTIEHLICNEDVAGLTPVAGSNIRPCSIKVIILFR